MTHDEWIASTDPAAMLAWLTSDVRRLDFLTGTGAVRPPSPRQLRLFACACCRAVWDRLTDPRSRRAVEVAERYADGLATEEELEVAEDNARRSWESSDNPAGAARYCCINSALHGARCVARPHMRDLPPPATQAALLRTIIGDPFSPVTIDPHCRTPDVCAIASRIYDNRDWDALPMLADALQEAGCEDARVLEWLRGNEPCGPCEVDVGNQRMQVSGTVIQLDGDWGFPKNPKQTPAYLPQCKHCHGSGWRPMRQPVRCRGDWVVDLVLGRE